MNAQYLIPLAFLLMVFVVIPWCMKRLIQGPRAREVPVAGQRWRFVSDEVYPPVTILEVKRWRVRYSFINGVESVLGQDSFRRMYRPMA